MPFVQSWVVGKITNSLSETLETEVSIKSVNLSWSGKMKLNDILIKDKQSDSLFFIHQLQLKLLSYNKEGKKAIVGNVVIKDPLVNFRQRTGDDELNFQFLVDIAKKDTTGNGIWNILFKNIEIENGQFRFRVDGHDPPSDRTFDENDFAFNQINGEFKDFYLIGDSLDFKIKNLNAVEKNGLEIERLVCKAKVHRTGMEFQQMQLKTAESVLEEYIAFDYSSYQSFRYFIDSVYVRTELNHTEISASDLAYFSYNLNPYKHNRIRFKGKAKGYVSNFKVTDFELGIGASSTIKGDIDLRGLPEWRSSFINLKVDGLSATTHDIEEVMKLKLPDKLHRFNAFNFKGHVTGFYTDFAADGVLHSNMGKLISRINFKLLQNDYASYTGKLVAENFDIGRFLENNQLGKTSFSFVLEEGQGLTFEKLRTRFKSEIDYLDFNGTRIQDIKANGLYTDQKFDGEAWLNDPNADFTFNGKVDFKSEMPTFDFASEIRNINLQALNFDTTETLIAANLVIKMTGNDPDNISGFANLSDIKVSRQGRLLEMDTLNIQSSFGADNRKIAIQSDYLNGDVEGEFSLNDLSQVYQDFLNTLFPDFYDSISLDHEIKATANFQIKENDLISYWTPYNVKLGNGKLRIDYDTREESLESSGRFDYVSYDEYTGNGYALVVRKRPHQLLNLSADVANLTSGGEPVTTDVLLNASILPNYVEFLLDFADTSDLIALRSYGSLDFGNDSVQIELEQSTLYLDQQPWVIEGGNYALWANGQLVVDNFNVSNEDQYLTIRGIVSDQKGDRLLIHTTNLDLSSFNPLLEGINLQLGGVSDDSIGIFQMLNRPVIHGNIKIQDLAINGDTLGNLEIRTKTDKNPLILEVVATVTDGLFKNVSAEGKLDLTSNNGKISMNVMARNASIKPMEVWFKGVASQFDGEIDGDIRVYGTFSDPKFKGVIEAKNVSLLVDYLNTMYFINDKVGLSDKSIDFKRLKIQDERGDSAFLKGQIKHDFFGNMVFNIAIEEANNIMVLNTTQEHNDVFYGTGFATGRASFKGPVNDMVIQIKGKTNRGSRLTIPIYDESDNDLVDYIRFKKEIKDKSVIPVVQEENDQKMTMIFDFDLTEEAEFILLFDEVLDDKISGRGSGHIKMEYATGEEFYMYGVFTISEGIYPFSSPTLVSEKFDLRKGGQVIWNGDPYNAMINLQAAVARNRANPSHLMGTIDGLDDEYNTNIKMNVILKLKGELFNPDITFDWEFPETGSVSSFTEFNALIRKIETDPDELNRQVFSLLTFGSFSPAANFGLGSGSSPNDYRDIVSSSIGTFLSNQVNSWISEYDQNWDFGVDYMTRSGITDQERAELIFSARRKLLNERVELAASYNTNAYSGKNPYNVDLVYKLKKDGTLKLKAYHKLANDPTLGDVTNVTTTGVGFYFRRQFDRIRLRKKKDAPE